MIKTVLSIVQLYLVVNYSIGFPNVHVRGYNVNTSLKVLIEVREPIAFIPNLVSLHSVAAICTSIVSYVVSSRGCT